MGLADKLEIGGLVKVIIDGELKEFCFAEQYGPALILADRDDFFKQRKTCPEPTIKCIAVHKNCPLEGDIINFDMATNTDRVSLKKYIF